MLAYVEIYVYVYTSSLRGPRLRRGPFARRLRSYAASIAIYSFGAMEIKIDQFLGSKLKSNTILRSEAEI